MHLRRCQLVLTQKSTKINWTKCLRSLRKLVGENFLRSVFNLFRGLWLVHFANSAINFEIIFRNAAFLDSIISTLFIKMLKMLNISNLITLFPITMKTKMLSALKLNLSKDGHDVNYFDMNNKNLTVYDRTYSSEFTYRSKRVKCLILIFKIKKNAALPNTFISFL